MDDKENEDIEERNRIAQWILDPIVFEALKDLEQENIKNRKLVEQKNQDVLRLYNKFNKTEWFVNGELECWGNYPPSERDTLDLIQHVNDVYNNFCERAEIVDESGRTLMDDYDEARKRFQQPQW